MIKSTITLVYSRGCVMLHSLTGQSYVIDRYGKLITYIVTVGDVYRGTVVCELAGSHVKYAISITR